MNKIKWILLFFSLIFIITLVSKILTKKSNSSGENIVAKASSNSYWTCPMHPQVHLDHAGECPICHMKLVQVQEQVQDQNSESKRSSVVVSEIQSDLLGIQRQLVEKMDIVATIPISGRIVSSSSIAFQVYESDLPYIKTGMEFKGDEISGIITSVDSIADPSSRTVRVTGTIKSGPKNLISETSFRGDIKIELKNKIAIPESSVLHTGKGDLVYLFSNQNTLIPTKVRLGLKSEGFYEVLEGLEVGETISSGPNFLIDSESKIRSAQ